MKADALRQWRSLEQRRKIMIAGACGAALLLAAVIAAVLNQLFGAGIPVAPLASDNNGIDKPIAPDAVLAAVSPFIVV